MRFHWLARLLVVVVVLGAPIIAWDGFGDAAAAEPFDVQINPGDDIQAAVNGNDPGTVFFLASGVHRFQFVQPKNSMVFFGEPGTILSGGRVLSGWNFDGQRWWVDGQTQEGPVFGFCESGWERCNRPEDLFFDNVPLRHATSLGGVGPGTWFFDYGANRIYVGNDPAGHTVETSVTAKAFSGTATGVVIRDLTVEKYASRAQEAAIDAVDGLNWVVEGIEARLNHAAGIRLGPGGTLRDSYAHTNGQQGVKSDGPNVLFENNEIAFNNFAHFHLDWEGGGTKFSNADNGIIRGNWAHDNYGAGLWVDVQGIDVTLENNVTERNYRAGIFFEVSDIGSIHDNYSEANGVDDPRSGWYWGPGILVSASRNVEVFNNTVVNNGNGITAVQQRRGSGPWGPFCVEDLNAHDNVVTMNRGKTGAAQDYDPPSGDSCPLDIYNFGAANNHFENNTYYLDNLGADRFGWVDTTHTFTEWQGFGHDDTGSAGPLDTTVPTWVAPAFTEVGSTDTTLTLQWSGAVDDHDVAAYRIYAAGLGQVATTAGDTSVTLSRLTPGVALTLTVEAVDIGGNESTTGPSLVATPGSGTTPPPGLVFVPTTACAVFDTRPDEGGAGAFAAGESRSFDVLAGSAGCADPVPAAAQAVFLNLVAVTPAGVGELELSPQGEAAGGSVVPYQAFSPNMNNSNAVPMRLANGSVDVRADGAATEVRGVVLGYWVDPAVESGGLVLTPLNPCAVFDTRILYGGTGPLGPNDVRTFDVMSDGCGIPVEAEAILLNLVAVNPAGGGNLKIASQGVPPEGGVVNYQAFTPNLNNSNAIVVPLNQGGAGGQLDVYTNGSSSEVRGVVLGYLAPQSVTPDGLLFHPTPSCQAFDNTPIPGNASQAFDITGSGCGIPTAADGVFLNLQALGPLGGGNLKVAAQGVAPLGGVVNYQLGVDNANAIVVDLNHAGTGGQIDVWTNGQGSSVGGVALGYYASPGP